MKAYLVTTAALFGLLAVVHVWQIVAEWPGLITNTPAKVEAAIGLVAAGLCIWALRLMRVLRGRTAQQS